MPSTCYPGRLLGCRLFRIVQPPPYSLHAFFGFPRPLCDIKSISGCFTGPRTVTRLSFTA